MESSEQNVGESVLGIREIVLLPVSRCHVDCVTWSLRDACYGPAISRVCHRVSPGVIDLSRGGGLLWFATLSEPGLIDIKIIKDRDTPYGILYTVTSLHKTTKWNFETLIQDQDKFRIIIISKMPFCVKARTAGSRSPLPIMMIWNQFRRGTGYLTEFWVILYNRNKYKCAQKGLFSCCASAVHLKSLHLMTDDFGMMTYWKVMKVMMHILRMSKQ